VPFEKLGIAELAKQLLHFMGLEGSLPCLQKPVTDPSLGPDASSLHSPIRFLEVWL